MTMEIVEDQEVEKEKEEEVVEIPHFYTTKELCKMLNLSRSGITRIRERKEISFTQFGAKVFFTREQIEDFIKNSEIKRAV